MNHLPKVSIDLNVILNPYKFALILNGLDKCYSEIYVPETVFSIADESTYTYFRPFRDNYTTKDYDYFGFKPNMIEPNNFIASLQMLKRAKNEGMISFLDTWVDQRLMSKFLETDGLFITGSSVYVEAPSGIDYYLIPDRGGVAEGMLFHYLENSIRPVYGNQFFLDYLITKGFIDNVDDLNDKIDKRLETILRCPQGVSVDELFDFIKNMDIIENFMEKLGTQKTADTKLLDILALIIEFATTLAADNYVFEGQPVSSGALLVYKIMERHLIKNKN